MPRNNWLKNLQVNIHGYLEIEVSSSLRRETDGCLDALHFPDLISEMFVYFYYSKSYHI